MRTQTLSLLLCLNFCFACDDGGGGDELAGTGGEEACIPGQSVACSCTDGSAGAQICEPDGTGFGSCSCEGSDGGSTSTDGGSTSTDGTSTDGTSTDGTSTGDPNAWDGQSIPSWSVHMVPLFYASCGAGINGCHSREAYAAAADSDCRGWLSLEDEALGSVYYAGDMQGQATGCPDMALAQRLFELAPWQCAADSKYVAPNDLNASYMWRKIQGLDLCEVSPGQLSKVMPPPDSGIELTQMDIEMVEAWILGGAPSDN